MRKRRAFGRIYGMKYSWKCQEDRNRHKNGIKKKVWASSVGVTRDNLALNQTTDLSVYDINPNIPTTWRWVRGKRIEQSVSWAVSVLIVHTVLDINAFNKRRWGDFLECRRDRVFFNDWLLYLTRNTSLLGFLVQRQYRSCDLCVHSLTCSQHVASILAAADITTGDTPRT